MNYIKELNAFEALCENVNISSTAQLLWYKLMAHFNRLKWVESAEISNKQLTDMTKTTEKTAIRAREELSTMGIISYQKGKKGKPTEYTLNSIHCNFYSESAKYPVKCHVHFTMNNGVSTIIYKNNKHSSCCSSARARENTPVENSVENSVENFLTESDTYTEYVATMAEVGEMGDVIRKLVKTYWGRAASDYDVTEIYGMLRRVMNGKFNLTTDTAELLSIALTIAADREQKNLAYLWGIFRNFRAKKINSVAKYWEEA